LLTPGEICKPWGDVVIISLFPTARNSAPRGIVPVRVLVVDDEPLIRWSICVALTAAGFDADSAATADEARRLAAAGVPPRVVLLDVHPDGQPQPLIDQIRAISPDSRFLVMTTARRGSGTPGPFGDVNVIEKPFDLAHLVAAIAELARDGSPASLPGEQAPGPWRLDRR
jgi:two-component system KDP operon response regulator KdpE